MGPLIIGSARLLQQVKPLVGRLEGSGTAPMLLLGTQGHINDIRVVRTQGGLRSWNW